MRKIYLLHTQGFTNQRNKGLISMDRKQAYSHTYNTLFHIKVVYSGFIILNAIRILSWGDRHLRLLLRNYTENGYIIAFQ